MSSLLTSLGVDRLSIPERLQLVEEIWDSIAPSLEQLPLTQEQRDELDRRLAAKRGGGAALETLTGPVASRAVAADELIAIDRALSRLEGMHDRQGRVVLYRFFGGLTDEEIAQVLRVSLPTVRRDWRAAKAWLTRELGSAP